MDSNIKKPLWAKWLICGIVILMLTIAGCASESQSDVNNELQTPSATSSTPDTQQNSQPESEPEPEPEQTQSEKTTDTGEVDNNTAQVKQEDVSQESTPQTTVAEPQTEQAITVYVTNTGSKYHRAGCRSLKKSQIPMSLEDAKASGYQPCGVCGP